MRDVRPPLWVTHYIIGARRPSSVEIGQGLRLWEDQKTEPHFSEDDGGSQNGSISRRRSWIIDCVGNPKPTVSHRFPKQRPKASGCDSAIKSRKSCGGQPAQTLPWRAIEQVFRPKTVSLGRLCEVFGRQPFRWGDCARFSPRRLPGGVIVRGFRPTIFPVGCLCESFAPQTFRWADCARFSSHRLPDGVFVRGFQATDFPVGCLCEVFGQMDFVAGEKQRQWRQRGFAQRIYLCGPSPTRHHI